MNRLSILLASLLGLVILLSGAAATGCGGGGGGTTGTTGTGTGTTGSDTNLTGRVLSIVTGGPLSPAPSVQAGNRRTTATDDGAFAIAANAGNVNLLVDSSEFPVFTFASTAVVGTTVDVGDLYVGPERVTVSGTLRSAVNGAVISGGTVSFAGRRATTSATGRFTLTDVAYATSSPAAFLGIVGSARATGFLAGEFTTQGATPTGGALELGDVSLTPESDPTPPGLPFNVLGTVSPFADAPGTVVSLSQSGTEVRRTTIGSDAAYGFWVAPGTYTITFTKDARVAGPFTVTLADTTSVVRQNATLP